ncbi:MAG: hypothetical protein CVT49_00255 [candidate division Zixibacteria bacterium HGW-Zixibacteria-1]|nr:MAG: hypothetical protein CVT49_00255 [candidate division Zixibacteria bacterium HGW-Zixibacteria-1]
MSARAAAPAVPFGDDINSGEYFNTTDFNINENTREIGTPVDFIEAIGAGANYLRVMQADITEDNAGNGTDGVDENPDDPDDGGWDWRLTSPPAPFSHSASSSPTNIYGVSGMGLIRAYQKLGTAETGLYTAITDAADYMAGNPGIRSSGDLIYLLRCDSLIPGMGYADAAKAKFDARIAAYGNAAHLADSIKNIRYSQGYANGIIAWDIGLWVQAAGMLEGMYPDDAYDYGQAAVDMAEVVWQDSFNDNPGYFDVEDDKGYDPSRANVNYWWYNIGLFGLITSFQYSGSHVSEIGFLVNRLLESQNRYGFFSYQWGGYDNDAGWQTTAYSVMALALVDQAAYQTEISHACYWTAATQDASGGWVYDTDEHLPEIGSENTVALYYAEPPQMVIVDDDFISQEAVDAYNIANGTGYLWGYDAFATITDGIAGATVRTVSVLDGFYTVPINIEGDSPGGKSISISIIGSGQLNTVFQPTSTVAWNVGGYNRQAAIRVVNADVTFQNMTMDFDLIKASETAGILYWNATGEISGNLIQNMNVPDNFNGYREITSYFRAPDYTPESRAHVDILNNTFLKTGRIGIVTHDYVDATIDGNTFDKVDDDFGYAIEMGSASTGIISNNVFANYDTWAASDASTVAAILVENLFTQGVTTPIEKTVLIENNEMYHCQYGIYIGSDYVGLAGDVDINATIKNNNIHDNITSGSYSVGGIVLVEKNMAVGSSLSAVIDSNQILNNVYNGIYMYTEGSGDISAEITYNTIEGHYNGIRVAEFISKASNFDLMVHHNILSNGLNARDDIAGGYWDDGISTGNCWSDYETNSGYPDQYNVDGNAGTIDRFPNIYCGDLCDCWPGNANNDAGLNLLDVTSLISYLYKTGSAPVPYSICSGDADCNCSVNLLDITRMISYIYKSGTPPCDCETWVDNCGWPPSKSTITNSALMWHQTAESISAPAGSSGREEGTIHPAPAYR